MQSERSSNEVIEPVTEELIQLMGNSDENGRAEQVSSDSRDKRNWMSSAKLWTAGSAAKCENCKSVNFDNYYSARPNLFVYFCTIKCPKIFVQVFDKFCIKKSAIPFNDKKIKGYSWKLNIFW